MNQQDRSSALRDVRARLGGLAATRPLLYFVVGLGLGLLAAWYIWPVSWYDTDPSDLRARHKAAYILGVADSLAVTGDTNAARDRIIELTDDEIDLQQVADLVESVALDQETKGNAAAALRVRRMAAVVNLPDSGQVWAPIPEPEESPGRGPLWLILGIIASLAMAVGAIWGVMKLLSRRAQRAEAATYGQGPPLPRHRSFSDLDAQGMEHPSMGSRGMPSATSQRSEGDFRNGRDVYRVPQGAGARPVQREPAIVEAFDEDDLDLLEGTEMDSPRGGRPTWEEQTPEAQGRRRVDRDLPNGALGVFEAEYEYGEDDYDVSQSVEAQDGEFFGECGMSVCSVLEADEAQKVNGLQIWLFDKSDRRTVSQILVTQHAYENEALNTQLSAMGELVLAEEGQTVVLETLNLQATATIQQVSYLSDTRIPNAAFERVYVEFVVERANGLD